VTLLLTLLLTPLLCRDAAVTRSIVTSVCVVIPCFNEAGNIDPLLGELCRQIPAAAPWSVVVVNDSSTDETAELVATAARDDSRVALISGRFGSPGAARTVGANSVVHAHQPPQWLLTIDADIELAPDWFSAWNESLCAYDVPSTNERLIGAVNGVEVQSHLFANYPNAQVVSSAFGTVISRSEAVLGITNLNGVNHAVRTSAYLTAGPYVQPTMLTADGSVSLAGEDWDLGVRIRQAGFTIGVTEAAVLDKGRRLLADVYSYVSGDAYEGAFLRLDQTNSSADVSKTAVAPLVESAVERSLRHFFFKPILAGCVEANDVLAVNGLRPETRQAIVDWMSCWPSPTFAESRNGFMFGRLPRFSAALWRLVAADMQLDMQLDMQVDAQPHFIGKGE
jgi:Glycosyl transferase family 2